MPYIDMNQPWIYMRSASWTPLLPPSLGILTKGCHPLIVANSLLLFPPGFPGGSDGKDLLQCRRPRFNPRAGKISWRTKWQPTPGFLPGKSHGQGSLADFSPRGCRVGYNWVTKTHIHTHTHTHTLFPPVLVMSHFLSPIPHWGSD